jgi:hypothetical protein
MGRPATRGRFYHLYLNGLYWGLYQTDERAEAAYGETYFGGNQWDYDVVKTRGELTDGTYDSWRRLWQKWSAGFSSNEAYFNVLGRNPNGSRNRDYEHLLDPGNLVDYMIILYYSGDSDGPPNNYFSIYNRTHPDGWKFFEHDSEHSLDRGRFDMVNTPASGWSLAEFHPRLLHQGLMENEEYRMLFADHVARHCLNGGVLTEAESLARMDRRVRQIDRAIMANSARWGDSKREPALTRLDWLSAVSAQRSFFRSRSSILIAQLRSAGWYPTPEPPVFSRHGGLIGSAEELQVTGRSGTVYATVNGHDPRIIGGAIRSTARRVVGPLSLTTAGPNVVRARVLDGTEWSALTSATFLVDTDPASASNLAISEIHYRPAAPSPQEIAAGYDERSAFEFIELLNTGSRFIDLAGVRLSEGVRFDFEETNRYRSLSPGGRVLIVNDAEAFGLRYRGRLPIAGEFTGSLNNDGERLLVQSPGGDPVADVTFNDAGAWPREADGGGYSLVRIDATRAEGDPANWRASSEVGGNPGGTDSLDYHSWLQSHGLEDNEEDRDADGLSPFLEYVLGGSPMVADAEVVLPKARIETVEVGAGSDDYLVLHVRRRVGADDARFEAEWSPDLVSWQRDSVFLGAEDNGDGTETLRFRAPRPHNEGKAQFLRVHTSR